jgi:hypothetical protein
MKTLCLSLALLFSLPAAAETARVADPVQTKSFEVRFRPLADAAELVSSVLSAEGEVTQQFRLKRLVVKDHASVLAQVPGLLESFDLPPRNVEVTVSLLLGSDRRDQEAGRHNKTEGISREIRGITETLGDFTKWTAYETLGTRSVTAVEGTPVTLNISDEYRVVFEVGSVPTVNKVELRSFALFRVLHTADGLERMQEIYSARVMLPAGRLQLVGAAKSPEAKQALFVGLQATPR